MMGTLTSWRTSARWPASQTSLVKPTILQTINTSIWVWFCGQDLFTLYSSFIDQNIHWRANWCVSVIIFNQRNQCQYCHQMNHFHVWWYSCRLTVVPNVSPARHGSHLSVYQSLTVCWQANRLDVFYTQTHKHILCLKIQANMCVWWSWIIKQIKCSDRETRSGEMAPISETIGSK